MLIWILFLISIYFSLKIRNRKIILKLIKVCFKIVFSPFKLISFLIKNYLKKREIKNKLAAKEELRKQRIEMKIKLLKDNLNKN